MLLPLMLVLLCGCGDASTENITQAAESTQAAEQLDITALRKDGKLMFGFSADDFVSGFNAVYEDKYGEDYLSPTALWNSYEASSPLGDNGGKAYCFTENGEILSMPTVTLFTDDDGGVYEIMATFDDHGYQDWLNKKYGIICENMLETLLPDTAEDKEQLYRELYSLSETNFYGDTYRFPPSDFYRSGDVGLYAYYGGGTVNICAVPADDELENELSQADSVIHVIK